MAAATIGIAMGGAGSDTALVAKWQFLSAAGQVNFINVDANHDQQLHLEESGNKRLDLFQHRYDQHMLQKASKDDGEHYILAPGVEGEFFIILINNSDVSAEVDVVFSELADSAEVPMEFNIADMTPYENEENRTGDDKRGFKPYVATEKGEWVTLDGLKDALMARINLEIEGEEGEAGRYEGIAEMQEDKLVLLPIPNDQGNENIFQVIKWRWAYGDTNDPINEKNVSDTKLGKDSADEGDRTSYGIDITVTATQARPGN